MGALRPPCLRVQALAVWRRNARVWHKLLLPSLLANFGEPLLYLLGLGYGLGHFIGRMAGMDYLTFLASGIVASSAMNTASFEGMYSVYTRMVPQHTYDGMLATPLEVDDIVAGEALWCASKSLISGAAILVVAYALGAASGARPLLALPVVFLVGLSFAGPAILVSALARGYDFFNYYVTLLLTPMLLLCGVFYPISSLPAALQQVVAYLPLTLGVDLIRPLIAGQPAADAVGHVALLAGYALAGYYAAVVRVRRRLVV